MGLVQNKRRTCPPSGRQQFARNVKVTWSTYHMVRWGIFRAVLAETLAKVTGCVDFFFPRKVKPTKVSKWWVSDQRKKIKIVHDVKWRKPHEPQRLMAARFLLFISRKSVTPVSLVVSKPVSNSCSNYFQCSSPTHTNTGKKIWRICATIRPQLATMAADDWFPTLRLYLDWKVRKW